METETVRATKVEMTKLAIGINVFANTLLFGIAGIITLKSFEHGVNLFSWHPTFLVMGVR